MKEIIDFHIQACGKDSLNGHWHSHGAGYEILLVHRGCGNVLIGSRLFDLRPHAVYFINGMETHCTVPEKPQEYVRSKVIVTAGLLDRVVDAMNGRALIEELFCGGSCFVPDETDLAYIDAEFSAVSRALREDGPYTPLRVATAIFGILLTAYQKTSKPPLSDDRRIAAVLQYIDRHLSQKISLEALCRDGHISRYYLCHEFKKKIGMPIFAYILSRRLSLAQRYLLESEKSISEIAALTGFSDFSYFSKIFRMQEGISPREFRRVGREHDKNRT